MYLKESYRSGTIFLLLPVLILVLNSCKVLQPYSGVELANEELLFRNIPSGDTSNISDIPWRSFFSDPFLVALIDESLANNPDMQIAAARIKKAEASFEQSRMAFLPTLHLAGNATLLQNGSDAVSEDYSLTGNTSWEIDLSGRLRNARRAELNLFLKSEAYKRAVQTQLISDVAGNYYTLLALDAQLQVTERTVEFRNSNVETLKVMMESDMVTGADLVQSQANLYSARVTVPDIKNNIYKIENALSILIGRNPGPIERDSLSGQEFSADLKTGLPAQLLANRPDVQEAEYQLRYGYEMTNAARKSFYPTLTISASGGYNTGNISQLFNPSTLFWNLIGGLTQPLINSGLNRQRLKSALADQEQYVAEYRQVLLNAGQEVSNALYEYQSATQKISLRSEQIGYLQKAVDYTMELLKYSSSTTYTDVLMAEMNLLTAQLNGINDKLEQMQSVISLYRSLGGGWE